VSNITATTGQLRAFFEASRLMNNIGVEMPISILLTFLGVAMWGYKDGERSEEPLTLKEIARNVGLPQATVSRHLRYLGDKQRTGKPGLGLVKTEIWVVNQRQKITYLTVKGQNLIDQINYMLNKDAEVEL